MNDRQLFTLPDAHVHLAVANVMAHKIGPSLHSLIETHPAADGFEYRFGSGIVTVHVLAEIILKLDEIHEWLHQAHEPSGGINHIDGYVNSAGRMALTWMLGALFGEAYNVTSSEVRITWRAKNIPRYPSTPPPKRFSL